MREILFRGKCKTDGEWKYGCYAKGIEYLYHNEKHIIFDEDVTVFPHNEMCGFAEVIPETVGQYTGLNDKNGNKIFEGDVVSTDIARPYNIVEFRDGCFMFNCNDGGDDYYDIMLPILKEPHTVYEYGEVIGNIHDNPDLLKGGAEC